MPVPPDLYASLKLAEELTSGHPLQLLCRVRNQELIGKQDQIIHCDTRNVLSSVRVCIIILLCQFATAGVSKVRILGDLSCASTVTI